MHHIPLTEEQTGQSKQIGPFSVQWLALTHSIPDPNALMIRTAAGNIFHSGDWKLDEQPLVFVDTHGSEAKEVLPDRSTSYENPGEAAIIKELVLTLLQMGAKAEQIGVISPYAAQVKRIKKELDFEDMVIEIKSVDGFQGREKEIILISFVRSNDEGRIGFLRDLRRLNVAITRARRKLICVGDSQTLRHDGVYGKFLDYIAQNGTIRRLDARTIENR